MKLELERNNNPPAPMPISSKTPKQINKTGPSDSSPNFINKEPHNPTSMVTNSPRTVRRLKFM